MKITTIQIHQYRQTKGWHAESKYGLYFGLNLVIYGVVSNPMVVFANFLLGVSGKTRQSDVPEYTPPVYTNSIKNFAVCYSIFKSVVCIM